MMFFSKSQICRMKVLSTWILVGGQWVLSLLLSLLSIKLALLAHLENFWTTLYSKVLMWFSLSFTCIAEKSETSKQLLFNSELFNFLMISMSLLIVLMFLTDSPNIFDILTIEYFKSKSIMTIHLCFNSMLKHNQNDGYGIIFLKIV